MPRLYSAITASYAPLPKLLGSHLVTLTAEHVLMLESLGNPLVQLYKTNDGRLISGEATLYDLWVVSQVCSALEPFELDPITEEELQELAERYDLAAEGAKAEQYFQRCYFGAMPAQLNNIAAAAGSRAVHAPWMLYCKLALIKELPALDVETLFTRESVGLFLFYFQTMREMRDGEPYMLPGGEPIDEEVLASEEEELAAVAAKQDRVDLHMLSLYEALREHAKAAGGLLEPVLAAHEARIEALRLQLYQDACKGTLPEELPTIDFAAPQP